MGQFCDSVTSMPVEERNELNTQALQDIYGSIDLLTDEIKTSDNGSYFSEISNSLDNLVTQTFELNKTMNNIAESLRVISHNTK